MDIRQLRYFLAMVDEGSINGAARRLGIRQSSLSQQLARLEDDIGDALFDRMGSGVALTRAGELLVDRARQIVAMVAETQRSVREDLEAGRGQIAIGAIPTVSPFVMPAVLADFRRSFPDTQIDFHESVTSELVEAVARADVEIALVASDIDDDRVTFEHICDEPLVIALSEDSPLASRPFLCRPDLEEEGIIVLHELHCLGDQVRAFCKHMGIDKQIRMEAGQLSTALEFVRRRLGLTMIPQMSLAAGTPPGIKCRPPKDGAPSRPIGVIRSACRHRSDLGNEVVDLIRRRCAEVIRCEHARL